MVTRPAVTRGELPRQRELTLGGGHPEQPGQRLGRAGREQLGDLVDVIHKDPSGSTTWQNRSVRSLSSGRIRATAMPSKCGLAWCASNASALAYRSYSTNASGSSLLRRATKSRLPGSARVAAVCRASSAATSSPLPSIAW